MLDVNLIRSQVLLVAEPGYLAEAAVRTIVNEAERHAAERAKDAGSLFEVAASPALPPGTVVFQDAGRVLAIIKGIRTDLEAARCRP